MDIKRVGAVILIVAGFKILIFPVMAAGSITGFAAATSPEEPAINSIISIFLILTGFIILTANK